MLRFSTLSRFWIGFILPLLGISFAVAQTAEDAIIARVNGEALLLSQLKEAALDQDIPPAALMLSGLDSLAYRKALTQLVDEQLLVQQAATEGLRANDMELARDIEEMLTELRNQLGSQEKMDEFLRQHHLTMTALRTLMTERERKRTLATEVVARRVVVDESAIARFTQERQAKKLPLQEVNLSQILVRCTPADRLGPLGEELKNEALRAAREAGTLKLNDLPGFLRRYNTLAVSPRVRTSTLGWLDPESLRPELRDPVLKMKPGEVTAPLATDEGYHVIVLLGRRTTRDLAFAAEYEQARTRLLLQLRRDAVVQLYDLKGRQIKLDLSETSPTQSMGQ